MAQNIVCPDGTYQPSVGQTDCTDCPAGSSCTTTTASSCGVGKFSALGDSTCRDCLPGNYFLNYFFYFFLCLFQTIVALFLLILSINHL